MEYFVFIPVIKYVVHIFFCFLEAPLAYNHLFVGLTTVVCAGGLILMGLIITLLIYLRVYCCQRSVIQSNNAHSENSEPITVEEIDINTSHNSAYGQVKGQAKEPQLIHDGGMIYEEIRDNSLYGIQPNAAYGSLLSDNAQCCPHLYEDPNKDIDMVPNTAMTDAV